MWWRLAGSNRWPPACKAGALPAELNPHIVEIKSTICAFNASIKCSPVALFLLSPLNPLRWALTGTPLDLFVWSGGPRTRFPAGKPRRLQHATGMLPRAAFRVHFGVEPLWTQSSRSWLLFHSLAKWWAKMDSNHRPHDYQSCALASWAIGPYRRNQSHNLRICCSHQMLACVFVSPLPIKPASLGFNGSPFGLTS